MSVAAQPLIGAVRLYQYTVRPLIGATCRFTPSCSDYALQALRAHGALRGTGLAAWRVLRCNPWCACGHDPVPPKRESAPIESVPRLRGQNSVPRPRGQNSVPRPRGQNSVPRPRGQNSAEAT